MSRVNENSHFETLNLLFQTCFVSSQSCFQLNEKATSPSSPLPPLLFSVSCVLFVASRRSLNETRHFRTLSACGINISGQFYAVPSDFPDSRSVHVHAKESALGFSFFLSLSFSFFSFRRAAIFFGKGESSVYLAATRGFVWNRGTLRGEKFLSPPFPCRQGKMIIAPSKVLDVIVTYWTADDLRRIPLAWEIMYRLSRIDNVTR